MAAGTPATGARSFGWAPTDDPGQLGGPSAAALYGSGRAWTAAGLAWGAHLITVNPTTGALSVSVVERSAPYHAGALRVTRGYDAQEQYAQSDYLRRHPNTDPRPHFFGNWQLGEEALVSATWKRALAEMLVGSGAGASLGYRAEPQFLVHEGSASEVEEQLRALGVPGRTLQALGWRFKDGDLLLKSRQGPLSLVSGSFKSETLIDPAQVELWRFQPASGLGEHYTSAYSYQELIDGDGLRESNPPAVRALAIDALGHSISFRPADAQPPYHTWLLQDGAGRRYRLELEHAVTYLDGNAHGLLAKAYVVTQLVDESAPEAAPVRYEYDGEGRLTAVEYPGQTGGAARRCTYAYDERGALLSIADPVGDTLTFEYVEDDVDVDARLLPRLKVASIADGEGNRIEYAYDNEHNLTRATLTGHAGDVRDVEIAYVEDTADTFQRYVTRQSVEVTLGPSAPQSVVTQTLYSDDGRFLPQATIDPLGNSTQFEYNAYNQTTAVVDALGHRREFFYDVSDTPTAAAPNRYDLLRTFETSVDVDGTPYDVETRLQYAPYDASSSGDAADAAQSTHRTAARTDALGGVAHYEYDDLHDHLPLRPSRLIDELGNVTTRSYDDRGATLSETDAVGSVWRWAYDEEGRLLSTTDPNGHVRHWTYDPSTGWLLSATDALGPAGDPAHSVRYEWNDAGQRVRDTDAVGARTEYAYTAGKRLRSVTQYDPSARTTALRFDAVGNLVELQDPAGNALFVRCDEANRVYELGHSGAAAPIRLQRDAAGRVTAMTDRNGSITSYEYDALGRLLKLIEPDWPAAAPVNAGKEVQVAYDPLGRRLRVSDSEAGGDYVYRYDPLGNLVQREAPDGSTLRWKYDARNALTRLYDGGGIVDLAFTRDGDGRLLTLSDSSLLDPSRTFTFHRSDGALLDNLYGIDYDVCGLTTRFTYDPNRQLTLAEHSFAQAPLASYGYAYRADGLLEAEHGTRTAAYDYDGRKQLVSEQPQALDGYDAAGNRLWRAAAPPPPAGQAVFDAQNRMVTDQDGTQFEYDANGNLLERTPSGGGASTRYAYDGANRLREVDDGTTRLSYAYDADGRMTQRVAHEKGTTHTRAYRYAHQSILAELDEHGDVVLLYTRDDQGRLLRRRSRDKLGKAPSEDPHSLFVLADGLGSVVRLVDWDGKTHGERDYDAWGEASGKGTRCTFGYRSGFEDAHTGLLRFGARWYDAKLGRWLSQDPLLAALASAGADMAPRHQDLSNLYRYVLNNPLGLWDPTGLNAVPPKGWPEPPGWKGGYKWKNAGRDKLIDKDGNSWHWHPEDATHNEHWDYETKRGKQRLSRDGKDLGDDAFKPKEEPKPAQPEDEKAKPKEDGDQTAKRVAEGAAGTGIAIGVGIGIWEVVKWGAAIFAAPETFGGSLGLAAATP